MPPYSSEVKSKDTYWQDWREGIIIIFGRTVQQAGS